MSENNQLQHSQGGVTTRQDATDLGVPMLPGDPQEVVGPEDALGEGPTRGDYRDRIGPASYQPHEVLPEPSSDPNAPQVRVAPQREYVAEIGDEPRKKGGVDTARERQAQRSVERAERDAQRSQERATREQQRDAERAQRDTAKAERKQSEGQG